MSIKCQIRDLTKRYGAHAAVEGMSLDVADGEFVVLLGPQRLRQDHDLAVDRRAGAARFRVDIKSWNPGHDAIIKNHAALIDQVTEAFGRR
jgi:hypothetical protein